jgi:hypothetical protein
MRRDIASLTASNFKATRRDPARMAAVVSALSFVEGGCRKFLTLAHTDEDEASHRQHLSYRQQERWRGSPSRQRRAAANPRPNASKIDYTL